MPPRWVQIRAGRKADAAGENGRDIAQDIAEQVRRYHHIETVPAAG